MGVAVPQIPDAKSSTGTQEPTYTRGAYAYGTVTLYGAVFQRTSASHHGLDGGPYNPTSFHGLPAEVQFGLFRFRSPLLTESLLLSFPPPTRMLPFGGFPLGDRVARNGQEVPFGDPRLNGCMLLTGAFRSLPRPSSAYRAKPSPWWA